MNEKFDTRPRTLWDSIQFVISFYGCLMIGAGIVGASVPLTVFGFLIIAWGISYFLIKQSW